MQFRTCTLLKCILRQVDVKHINNLLNLIVLNYPQDTLNTREMHV